MSNLEDLSAAVFFRFFRKNRWTGVDGSPQSLRGITKKRSCKMVCCLTMDPERYKRIHSAQIEFP